MPPKKRITLQQIADAAGVSKATVSLALHRHPRIPEATGDRIRRIARELGYRPDPQLSKLMAAMKREPAVDQGMIGFIRSGPTTDWDPLESMLFQELSSAADDYGYTVEPFWLLDPHTTPERVNTILWNRGIEGLVIPMIHPQLYNRGVRTLPIDWDKFCVVEIADTIQRPVLSGIRHDHFGGMLRTLGELEALGYGRIGLSMWRDVATRTHHRWTSAYLLWKELRGFGGKLPVYFPERFHPDALAEWVERNRLDVVVGPGTEVLRLLRLRNFRVPEDLGYATLHRWGPGSEHITGIDQDLPGQARVAVEMLIGLIHRKARGAIPNPIFATSPGTWRPGDTTRPPEDGHDVKPLDLEPLIQP